MFVVLGWFGGTPVGREHADAEIASLTAAGAVRHDFGGDGWHVTVCRLADAGGCRWPAFVTDGEVTAVSLVIPVGAVAAGGPAAMACRLLAVAFRTLDPSTVRTSWIPVRARRPVVGRLLRRVRKAVHP